MKKISAATLSLFAFLQVASPAFAQGVLDLGVKKSKIQDRIIDPDTPIGAIVSFAVAAIIVISFLLALIFIVIGAVQWITSGGDKAKVADARNHILAAVIGLVLVVLSFLIVNIVITALGLGTLTNLRIPTLNEFT